MANYVVIAFGMDGPSPQYLSCRSTDAGATPVVAFSAGASVQQGSIVIPGEALPGVPYEQWNTPANGWWVATASIVLPQAQPLYGASVDGLHFSLGPSIAPSG